MSAHDSDRRCREYHSDFRVCLLRHGRSPIGVSYRCRGQHSAGAGELMAFEPGDHHVTTDVTGKICFDVIGVSIERVQAAARALGLHGEFHFKSPHITHPAVAARAHALVSAAAVGADPITLECLCALLVRQLIETCGEAPPPLKRTDFVRHFGVRKVRDHLRTNFHENLNLEELARSSGLSRFGFAHAFKRYVGLPPHAYLSLRRACEARQLVEQGVPIVDVMTLLGYTDVPSLTRTLRTYFGVTPARWRVAFRANSTRTRPSEIPPAKTPRGAS